jgi:hypothetical protein
MSGKSELIRLKCCSSENLCGQRVRAESGYAIDDDRGPYLVREHAGGEVLVEPNQAAQYSFRSTQEVTNPIDRALMKPTDPRVSVSALVLYAEAGVIEGDRVIIKGVCVYQNEQGSYLVVERVGISESGRLIVRIEPLERESEDDFEFEFANQEPAGSACKEQDHLSKLRKLGENYFDSRRRVLNRE